MINRFPNNIIDSLKDSKQNLKYHPEGSVYNHILQVYENTQRFFDDINLSVTALFHDLGKIDKVQFKELETGEIKISNIGHEFASIPYITNFNSLFNDLDVNWDLVTYITENHMRTQSYLSNELKKSHKRKMFEDSTYFLDLIKFAICDRYNPLKEDGFPEFDIQLQNGKTLKVKRINNEYKIEIV